MEIDNHADKTVLGSKCLVIYDFNRPVDLSGYDPTSGIQECATIIGATAYDQPVKGQAYMLVQNQDIHCKNLTLLCPMQSRSQGVKINELPKFLCTEPDDETNAIVAEDTLVSDKKLIIPLSLKGVTSYFTVWKPSIEEYGDEYITHIIMTDKEPVWEPSEDIFSVQE